MIDAEHRRPLAAFLVVCAAGFLITGFGLRTQVVQVLVDNGAPAALVGVVAPDVMLGETLSSKPAPPAAAAPSTRGESTGGSAEPTGSASTEITLPPASGAAPAAEPAPRHRAPSQPKGQSKGQTKGQTKGAPAQGAATSPVTVTAPTPKPGTSPTAPVTGVPAPVQPSTGKPAPALGAKPAAPIVKTPVRAAVEPVLVPGRSHGDGHVKGDRGRRGDHGHRSDHANRHDRGDRQDRSRHSSASKPRGQQSQLVRDARSDSPSVDRPPRHHVIRNHSHHHDGSQVRRPGQRGHDRGHTTGGHGTRSRR